jgi:hypothetical protein
MPVVGIASATEAVDGNASDLGTATATRSNTRDGELHVCDTI